MILVLFFKPYGIWGHETIERVWEMIMSFAGYSFCKGHSCSYIQVAQHSCSLRANYPAEFMAAVLSNGGGFYQPFAYVAEAMRMGLGVLPPDESVATPTQDLATGVIDTPPRPTAIAPNPRTEIAAAFHGRWGLTPAACASERDDTDGLVTISGATISFHRPLQDYFAALADNGLWVDALLELPDPVKGDDDRAASAEIPLFLALRARRV